MRRLAGVSKAGARSRNPELSAERREGNGEGPQRQDGSPWWLPPRDSNLRRLAGVSKAGARQPKSRTECRATLRQRGGTSAAGWFTRLAAPQGFEPRYADPESAVLPLNEGALVRFYGCFALRSTWTNERLRSKTKHGRNAAAVLRCLRCALRFFPCWLWHWQPVNFLRAN